MPFAEANGIRIFYEIRGEGEPLVLIPGLSIDITLFERIISELAKKYCVIAFDNRGAGRSDKPDIPYSVEMMVDDTAGLLSELKIERAHVIGISLGGRIAIALALKHTELVKSLTLVSTGPKVQNSLRRKLLFVLIEIPRRIGALGKKYPQPYYAYMHQRKASQNYDATPRLHEIRIPTLILHGDKDRVVPKRMVEKMHTEIQNSKIVSFRGGHMFLFWKQKEFLDAVEDFLRPLQKGA